MSERDQSQQGPLAPRRPLSGAAAAEQERGPSTAQESQTTMSTPIITGETQPQDRVPPQGPQARPSRPSPPAAAPPRGGSSTGGDTARTSAIGQSPDESGGQSTGEIHTPERSPQAIRARKARLRLTRIDPWSVMKMAFALSIALAIVTVVAVAIVWSVLDAAGVWESINASVGTVLSEDADSSFDITDYVGTARVLGLTTVVSAANVVLLTAISTLGAFLYNLAASLLGGLELTLSENQR